MGRLLLKFLIGGIAGLLTWMVMEPFRPPLPTVPAAKVFTQDQAGNPVPNGTAATDMSNAEEKWGAWESTFMLVLGSFVGLAVGGLDGYMRGGKRHTSLGMGLGLVFGAVGATLGHGVGSTLVQTIFPPGVFNSSSLPIMQIPARVLAITPIGLFLGAAIGGSSLTLKRTVQGAIGGAIGGAAGGAVFDIVGWIFSRGIVAASGQTEVGGPSRAITFVAIGALIGLFIGLVELLSRSAWLRLELGRNEGREWSVDTSPTFIGRSEGSQIPLFGDPNVAPLHASIVRQGGQYILQDGGSPIGTLLNGQRVGQAVLMDGAQIQIAGFRLQFRLKDKKAPVRAPEAYAGQGYPISGGQQPVAPVTPSPVQPTASQPAPGSLWGATAPSGPQQTVAYPSQSMPTQAYAAPPVPTAAMLSMVALDGPLTGQRFPISGPVDLGRESAMVPMAYDANASRRHAQISPGAGFAQIADLGSTNGTFVNGQRIQTAQVKPGDVIKVGGTSFRIEG